MRKSAPTNSRRQAVRQHLPFAMLLLTFVLLAAVNSIVVPILEGPDEDDHFRFVKYLADQRALPVQLFQPGGGPAGHQGWQPPLYYALAAVVISPIDTSDYEQHLWRNPAASYVGERACCGRNHYFHTASEDFPYTGATLAVHLARGVSILFGVLTVVCIYALVLTLFPGERWLALAATAVAALNPSFLYASGLVSNDVPLAAFCTLALLLGVRLLKGLDAPDLRHFALLGVVVALALLVKSTALGLIPLTLLVGAFFAWRARQWRIVWSALLGILAPCAVLVGWMYIRNQLLYGDPLAYRMWWASGAVLRPTPMTLDEFLQINLPWLWQTFWGGPNPGDFPITVLVALAVLTLLAALGMLLVLHNRRDLSTRAGLVFLLGWIGFIVVAEFQFIKTSAATDQGRYLFPAIGAYGLLMVLGLGEWARAGGRVFRCVLPRVSARSFAAALGAIAVVLVALGMALWVLTVTTMPAFARPPHYDATVLTGAQQQVDVNFSDQMALRGYSLSTRSLQPGSTLDVSLYWTALARMDESYRVFVHLVDDKGRVAGGNDVIPADGTYATLLWQPGEWVVDRIPVAVKSDAFPGSYKIEVGLYPFGQPDNRVNLARSAEDHVLLDGVNVGQ